MLYGDSTWWKIDGFDFKIQENDQGQGIIVFDISGQRLNCDSLYSIVEINCQRV
ncbi:DEHA2E14256p [Debaryomyces hansenii CBS767]|jgi:hypothetical protein|uniref:DEHA2E14256p n=1 Tax=Debaryomyces hansenii (strain ATCC 36239 / CBS 767 / BCRC 21394 / JCM 1990 / NBRC 0083 / IGC 2968) TaxID=284592 RepID=Q6BPE5_DEBHA|nr:DEHA2E14256p [Debaryomyces hansenii CBS767]CAG88169.1 DEHA2E14256p [Debaryomyces hansenii CBS767]|eukprot:XP_459925.1 DEHA2E14256p [Debaryomyces hansenii CBS767]